MATIPEYNSTPWALPVGCFSILVRHDAVIRSFPGGVRAFEHTHRPIRKSWVLYLLMALTREAADRVIARLAEGGLKPGEDVAVADTLLTTLVECPGVAFTDPGRHQGSVDFVSERRVEVPAASGASAPCAVGVDAGRVHSATTAMSSDPGHSTGPGLDRAGAYTDVTGLTRKADRTQFIEDLVRALVGAGLTDAAIVRERDGYTSIDIVRPELSALITFTHARRGEVPLVHWHGARADLRMVAKAWSSVNPFHHRKATSFPDDLNGVIRYAVEGLRAAGDGSAFRQEDGQ